MSLSNLGSLVRRGTVAAVVSALLGTSIAAAQDQSSGSEPGEAVDPVELVSDGTAFEEYLDGAGLGAAWRSATGISARARSVEIELDESTAAAMTTLAITVLNLRETEQQRAETTQQILDAATAIDQALDQEQDATIARNIARHELNVVNAILRIVAVDLFEVAYDADDDLLALDPATLNQAHRTRQITQSTVEEMIARKRAAEEELARREQALVDAIATRRTREADHAALVHRQAELTMLRTSLDAEARGQISAAAERWVLSETAAVAHLTPRALESYLNAEQMMTETEPGCHISWATIAAVGAVEGRHGTHGNRALRLDGTSERPIVGIPLDGETLDNYGNPVANIADTDGGAYDGDPHLDRAVGPMQFIPQTWEQWKRDGDGDGRFDPHDLDDATVGTAAYLCSYGSQTSWETWNRAVFGYNHSNAYVASVKGNLDRLSRLALPDLGGDVEWQRVTPSGAYVAPPPEPEPEPGSPDEGAAGVVAPESPPS